MFTSNEIRNIEFEEVKRGYNQPDVKAFLRKIAEQLEAAEQEKAAIEAEKNAIANEKAALEQKLLVLADKVEDYRKDEDSLRTALLSAQRLSDTIVKEANENAEIILNDANKRAEEIIGGTTRKIEVEKETLSRMKTEVSRFKNDVLNIYKSHLEVLSMIPEVEEEEMAASVQKDSVSAEEPAPAEPVVEEVITEDATIVFDAAQAPVAEIPSVDETPSAVVVEPESNIVEAAPAEPSDPIPDAFATFTPVPSIQPELEETVAEDQPETATEEKTEEPSRFGQLDFGDGFAFTTK